MDFPVVCNLWFRKHHKWLSPQSPLSQAQKCVPWVTDMHQFHISNYMQPTPSSTKSLKFVCWLWSVWFFQIFWVLGWFILQCPFTSSISKGSSQSPQITVTSNYYLSILDLNWWPRDWIWTSDKEIKGTIPDPMTHLLSPAVPEECDSLTELLLLTVFFQCLITYMKLQYFSHSHYVHVRYVLQLFS